MPVFHYGTKFILMAGVRALGLVGLVGLLPTAAPVIAASLQQHQHRQLRVGKGFSSVTGRLLQRRGLNRCFASRAGQAGGASLVLLASAVNTLGMAVSEEISDNAEVAEDENMIDGATLPDLLTEFMVNMSCEGCVKSVRKKLEPLEGVKSVDIDLANQVVRIVGSASIRNLTSAIDQTGRDVRLIGQGLPSSFTISAAVAEFKGPQVNGVVRFSQVTMDLARIDASFSGLKPGSHAWSVNTYGDLTQGAASTGGIFESESPQATGSKNKPLGDLGILDVNGKGEAHYSGTKASLQVSELIGRSVVLYESQDKSQYGITAAVIARSAGVGENYKKLCSCDGTVIWESTNNDFVKL